MLVQLLTITVRGGPVLFYKFTNRNRVFTNSRVILRNLKINRKSRLVKPINILTIRQYI